MPDFTVRDDVEAEFMLTVDLVVEPEEGERIKGQAVRRRGRWALEKCI
jgi:hypothetical protein